ncbi:unnamed protein product [Paramecium octaurelia]|uniref:Uncharacterized protein n=1 Tax=Paramecium octaurelia TaxID=43137 RepID=A0A8S1YJJ4_PAROT|nr:unnamed protein product [Paramecium octaurelia]
MLWYGNENLYYTYQFIRRRNIWEFVSSSPQKIWLFSRDIRLLNFMRNNKTGIALRKFKPNQKQCVIAQINHQICSLCLLRSCRNFQIEKKQLWMLIQTILSIQISGDIVCVSLRMIFLFLNQDARIIYRFIVWMLKINSLDLLRTQKQNLQAMFAIIIFPYNSLKIKRFSWIRMADTQIQSKYHLQEIVIHHRVQNLEINFSMVPRRMMGSILQHGIINQLNYKLENFQNDSYLEKLQNFIIQRSLILYSINKFEEELQYYDYDIEKFLPTQSFIITKA